MPDIPNSVVVVVLSNDGQGVMLNADGWPMFYVSNAQLPMLITQLKSHLRAVNRRRRLEEKKRNV